ncbi:hypothetical protein MMC08_006278 [Hypocenomyce scalaris]|nr:hypothetical protein [Hypocenomyce scalaris]
MHTKAQKTELTAEALVDLEIPSDVHISPSGEQAVYVLSPAGRKGEHQVSSIWLAQVGRRDSARQLSSGLFHDRMPRWSADGESIAFLSDRSDRGKSCAIYILPLHGGEAYPITKADSERAISSFAWSDDGKFIAFLSPDEKTAEKWEKEKNKDDVSVYGTDWEFNRLRLLHVSTRVVTTLLEEAAHVVSFAWSEDSRQIACILQETPEIEPRKSGSWIETVLLADGRRTFISSFPGAIPRPPVWSDNKLYFTAGFHPTKFNTSSTVYQLSLESKEWSRYAHGVEDCAREVGRNGRLSAVKVLSGSSDQIRLLRDNTVLYSDEHKIDTADLVKTKDGNYVLVIDKSTISSPKELYSLEITSQKMGTYEDSLVQLTSHGESLASPRTGTSHPFSCKSSDGTTELDGLFLAPYHENKRRKSLPTVVLIHGGPYDRSTVSFDSSFYHWSPLILSSGRYGILLPNYRGGSSRGEDFAAHARGGMGTVDYDDVITLVDEGIRQGLVDTANIVVGGWSQGGFLSYLLAVRRNHTAGPEGWKIKGAICGAGVADWDMMSMSSDTPDFEAELAGGAPWKIAAKADGKEDTSTRQGSAIWEMHGKDMPRILILHGQQDERVPLTQAVAFRRGCQYHGVSCEMAVYPREGHSFKERAHMVDILKRIMRFCDICLS